MIKIPIPKIKIIRPDNVDYIRTDIVPQKLADYITDMNYVCAKNNNANIFQGREKEITQIFNSLQKTLKPNIILLGDTGVGKSAIIKSCVYRVLEGKCPKELISNHFIFWDIEKTLAVIGSENKKYANDISEVIKFLTSYSNLVVVIDEIHLMASSTLLIYYLSNLINLPNVKLIGMSSAKCFYDFFEYDKKALASVDIISIREPKPKKIYPMVNKFINFLETTHGVKISEEIVNYTISVSSAFYSELKNPGLTLNFIEKSMITAKEKMHSSVTKEDVNTNFNFNYELFNQMSNEDKKITAYHEAGHFIVSRMSKNIRNFKTTAMTIIPSEHFLGITLFEIEEEKQTSCDFDYYVDIIASDLAGRIAELILQEEDKTSKHTSGAAEDLKNATQIARDIVTEYGMIKDCGQNMTYFCNYDLSDLALLSDDRKKLIDEETQKLINLAYKRGKEILNDNINLLHLIAKALLENEVLDENDLESICNQVK